MFGDHKYKKCDWDGAIEQYNQTVGYTEPSYVIRRFLDAQRIQNLTSYLEHLHSVDDGEHATKDHTTLLLNCYTKLKDTEKLDKFISSSHPAPASGSGATGSSDDKDGVLPKIVITQK